MKEYSKLSAAEIIAGLKKGSFSAVEICHEALSAAKNIGHKLNAFITITEGKALEQAKALDQRMERGDTSGALFGVPLAIKDNICLSDYPTTCASHILDGFVPIYDATCVQKLNEADAVIIGKTNMDEFAMGSSNENSYYGAVKNPFDNNLVPGGSSGGSAAAVAAGIVPIAFGSETGGSVRQPAAFCGIYGLKPTYGAISRYGLVAFASSMDQIGSMARNPYDLALAFGVACGRDSSDSTSVAFDHPNYPQLMTTNRKFTFGIPREYFGDGIDPDVSRNIDEVKKLLQKDGHKFVDISLPHSPLAIAVYYIIADAEASSNLARFDGVRYGRREKDEDLIAMYRKTRSAGFGMEVKRRVILGTYVLSAGYYDAYYLKAQQVRELIRRDFENAFQEVDILMTPTSPTAAFRIGEKISDTLAMYLSDIFTAPANLAGIPAISIPCGTVSDGRPVGLQLMATAFGELSLFQAAARLDKIKG
ncbi:MAG: Asp-tRNA(Asn)/Glu-tRNA(Gln) amidotransferase subunit GatA [candidate division Zixibacteria bacterium]|nr:Asp-tRNA(Asn)/Glu-tRNA(Gln) amidotransferase subunit GatA [candidate division Zixibacteria bacterium]